MKTRTFVHKRWYAVTALVAVSVCLMMLMIVSKGVHTATANSTTASSMPALRGDEAVSYLKQQGLYGSLGEAMAAARYGIHWSKHTPWKKLPGAYYAGNPAQQMTAFFTEEGIHLEAKAAPSQAGKTVSSPSWQMGMKLTGLGYGERLLRVAAGEMKVNDNRIEIARRVEGVSGDGGLREWYVNRAEGIEQGFTVEAAPGEGRAGEPLRLRLEVEGDLRARLADGGEAVDLIARGGEGILRYDKLYVYDAVGRELAAQMKVEGGAVWLEVDEGEAVYPLTIDPIFSQQQKLTASDGAGGDLFGTSVAISGESVVVGAYFDNVGANTIQGSAYVFVRSGTVWSQQQQLTASDGAAFDRFGFSVAISGESLVVGARFDDVGANGDQGSAYVFVRNGAVWSQQQQLTASDGAAIDEFGYSVAINGESVVVGAYRDDVGANGEQGSVYVFARNGVVWSQQQQLTASDGAANDQFGISVAISGESVVVGAPFDDVGANTNQGSAYVFVRNGAVWSQQQQLTASDGAAFDRFGFSVGISGESLVVGAYFDNVGANADQGSAYVFARNGTVWSQQQKLIASDGAANDRFGFSVGISGESVVVGANDDDVGANSAQGSAYVFARNGVVWSQQQQLTASDGAGSDQFGISVAISGESVVVGANFDDVGANEEQGSAYVFACTGTQQWVQQTMTTASDGAADDRFGISVAISGESVVVGAREDDVGANGDQGSAYVFVRSGTVWSQQQQLTASDGAGGDEFGSSVAISGESVVVGAPLDDVGADSAQGSAYVFARNGAVWSQQQKLTASDGAASDLFGNSVGISGESLVVGAFADDVGANVNQGSVYVFARNGVVWSQQQQLTASDGAANDQFGNSVGISGESVVVGAPLDNVGANGEQGSAYVFARNGMMWSQQQQLTVSDGAASDVFGSSVAISGESLVVGARFDDVGANSAQGSAYVFARNGAVWSQQQQLTAADGATFDGFGNSVGISGESVVVGAPSDDVGANGNQGSAYVFARNGVVWSQQQQLTASDGAVGDQFGNSVGISGESVVVGAFADNVGANVNQGSAYIFFRQCNTAPTITANGVTRNAGGSSANSQIATVSDAEDAENILSVTINGGASATVTGVTVSGISVSAAGVVTADVVAACGATTANFTLRVTDSGGLFNEATLIVTVNPDNQPPTLSCPANITTTTDANQCTAMVSYATPTASDNCPGATVACNPPSSSVFVKGTTTVTCTATDAATPTANTATCTFTVTVNDNQAPTLTCAANITQNTDPNLCSAVVNYALPTVSDNCPGVGAPVCAPSSGSTFPKGTTTVTCTATDAASLTGTCTFTVTVNDNQAPTISCPANVTQNTDSGVCTAVVNFTTPTASDNCLGATVACNPPSSSVFVKGTTTVTCTATDAATPTANTATCTFTVTVNDSQNPTLTCPANVTQNTDPNLCSAVVNFLPTANDNCPGVTISCTPVSGSSFPKGTTTVTCTATDTATPTANTATCTFTVTVNDSQPPTLTCPANVTQNTDSGVCTAVVNFTTPTASDNCLGATVACNPPSSSAFMKGTTTVTCTATDAATPTANTATCTFTVTVNDNQAPTLTCAVNVTANTDKGVCTAVVNFTTPTASDNCSGATVACSPASGATFAKGVTTVTCTATDAATPTANTATCTFTVTVNDNQAPTLTCAANITQANDKGACTAVVTYTAPTVSDNCVGVGAPTCNPISGSTFPKGTTTVTCNVGDASGNSASCSFTVTVNDTQAPTITCPENITAPAANNQCQALVNYSAPTVSDNCSGVGTPTCNPPSGSTFPKGTTTVNCSVSDAASLTAGCSFTVTVNDTQNPTISCPANVQIVSNTCVMNAYTAPTGADNCKEVSVVCVPAPSFCFPVGTTTVICTATDAAKNKASCSFTVAIIPCTITCPANITRANDPNQCGAVVTFAPTTTGSCGTVTCSPASGAFFPKGTTTVTCTTTVGPSCTFTVTIADTQPPTLICPVSQTRALARPTDATVLVTYPAPTFSDNCAGASVACVPPSGTAFPLGTTTVTCTATDAAGNTATCSFTVTVFDVCLQDDSSAETVLLFNSFTGDYRFCCRGTIFTGKGTVQKLGGTYTLTHNTVDRRVTAKLEIPLNRGTASLQSPVGTPRCAISDRDIRNNACVCQ